MVQNQKGMIQAAGRALLISTAVSAILALVGCATGSRPIEGETPSERRSAEGTSNTPPTFREILAHEDQAEVRKLSPEAIHQGNPRELTILGVKLKNTQFDIPISLNSRVEQWVEYFTGKGRPHFEKYLERSEYFIPYITPILRQNGMPEDLVYLAMIESGFNNHAASHAKAVGPWQFISATGKRYGLMVNWWVDERRDTRKSTLAAVGYLKDLYDIFKSWELAAAAYNAGEAKIARAVQRYGTRDFWALTRYRYLRSETRNYVPKIIAAALVAKNRTLFGFAPPQAQKSREEIVAGDGEVVKVEKAAEGQVQAVPSDETLEAILKEAPKEVAQQIAITPDAALPEALKPDPSKPLAQAIPTPQTSKRGEASGVELAEIEVQSPADVLHIAQAAGLTYQTVKSLNPDLLRWVTPPSVKNYRIKLPVNVKEKFLESYNHESYPRQVKFLTYKARPGDSLQRIAHHFGIRVEPIVDLNRIGPKTPLRAGSQVLLPMPVDRSSSLASLEIRDPAERRKVRRRKSRHGNGRVSLEHRQAARSTEVADSRE